MTVEIDDRSGFCFGVVNAISRAEESLSGGEVVYSLGDIVHNRMEVRRLEDLGLRTATLDELDALHGKKLLIRAHGEPPSTYRRARSLGMEVIDATCPVVAKLQKMAAAAHREMKAKGGQVVILGKRGHAEVVGLTGHAGDEAIVVEGLDDLDKIDFDRPVFLLSQTTQSLSLFGQVRDEIVRRGGEGVDVMVRDTICRQVSSREEHLREFSKRFAVVVFVAGSESSNGNVLFGVCRAANPNSYKIDSPAELRAEWFEGAGSVGVCGATSTPNWLMEEVAAAVRAMAPSGTK